MTEAPRASLYFRARDRRWVLSYVPPESETREVRHVTLPAEISSYRQANKWAKRALATATAEAEKAATL